MVTFTVPEELRKCKLLDLIPAEVWKKQFVVDIVPVEDGRSVVAYLAPYVQRVAISDHRIRHVDANSVTYDYAPSKTHSVQSRSVTGHPITKTPTNHKKTVRRHNLAVLDTHQPRR